MKAETAWKWMPATLLFATVVFAVWRVQLALGDPHFAAVENYYEQSEDWDAHMEEVRASAALGWKVQLQTVHAASTGEQDVSFSVYDDAGLAVEGLTANLKAFHNAYPKNSLLAELSEDSPGSYVTQLPLKRSGVWRWQLRLTRGEEVWVGDLKEIVERELVNSQP